MRKILLCAIFPLILLAREWTTLVYMAADNGLAQWADSDLVEMQAIGSDDNVTILVQVDKPNIGAQRLLIQKNGFAELDDLGIIDMCNWQTLDDFLQWGISTYPAKRYFVILWDHGSGWVFNLRPSFGSDWSSGNVLGIHNGDLRKAISTAYNNTGKKINLLAFDACVMQQIEVVFEIKDYIKVFLAPQTICPLRGFRYDRIFQELEQNFVINEVELSKKIVEINVENYIDVEPIVISSIDAGKLNSVRTALDDLFNNLLVSSPNQLIIDARMDVQTLPLIGYVPRPEDDYIDIGDFIKVLHDIFSNNETAQLLNAYNNTIIQSGYWGKDFKKTTGLTIWFPFQYLEFKQLLSYYDNLGWAESKWLQFLNWYYDQDDIRPTEVSISATGISDNNDFYLSWPASYDLASVDYHLVEAHERISLLDDACEDSSYWNLNGFVLTANNFYSGGHSFFSGDGSNLQNFIETKNILNIEGLGLLDLYLYYNTEEIADSLIIEYGPFRDVHYGQSQGWQERRTILPGGGYKLKISYHTNNTINRGGGYFDDVRVEQFANGRYIRQFYVDTTIHIFNKLRGDYYYGVYARDKKGNIGNLSDLFGISITHYAVPYSNPNPFQTACDIILDYSDSLHPGVEIFSISGRKIKRFDATAIEHKRIHWDGRDEANREVGAGLYFILLKDGSFKKIGKIVRQR